MTRSEVRTRLAERTKSISARFEALEMELPVSPRTVRKLLDRKNQIKKAAVIGAGLLTVAFLFKKRKSSGFTYQDGLERISDAIAREVRKNIKSGMDTEDAVFAALRKRPPVVRVGDGGDRNELSGTLAKILKQLLVSLGPSLIDLLAELLKSGRQTQTKN